MTESTSFKPTENNIVTVDELGKRNCHLQENYDGIIGQYVSNIPTLWRVSRRCGDFGVVAEMNKGCC